MNPEEPKRYNLDERTARFGEAIIAYAKKVPVAPVTRPLIDQLVRAGTSVGANYCEADDAESKKAFRK
jgi:four helix bundle protein